MVQVKPCEGFFRPFIHCVNLGGGDFVLIFFDVSPDAFVKGPFRRFQPGLSPDGRGCPFVVFLARYGLIFFLLFLDIAAQGFKGFPFRLRDPRPLRFLLQGSDFLFQGFDTFRNGRGLIYHLIGHGGSAGSRPADRVSETDGECAKLRLCPAQIRL